MRAALAALRPWLVSLSAVVAVACTGETDTATNITQNTATLRAKNCRTDTGHAWACFQYWKSSAPMPGSPTNAGTGCSTLAREYQNIPTNQSFPLYENVLGFDANTQYSFRVCGRENNSTGNYICSNVVSFTTLAGTEPRHVGLDAMTSFQDLAYIEDAEFAHHESSYDRSGGMRTTLVISARSTARSCSSARTSRAASIVSG